MPGVETQGEQCAGCRMLSCDSVLDGQLGVAMKNPAKKSLTAAQADVGQEKYDVAVSRDSWTLCVGLYFGLRAGISMRRNHAHFRFYPIFN